jgi:hypothetical protein
LLIVEEKEVGARATAVVGVTAEAVRSIVGALKVVKLIEGTDHPVPALFVP